MIKFGYTICYVKNVEKAIEFFENAFGMKKGFISEEKDYGELITGEVTLSFGTEELGRMNLENGFISASSTSQPLGIEIALVTDDVQKAHELAIKHGAKELKKPETKPWGQTVSYVRCPSGLLIELCTPIG